MHAEDLSSEYRFGRERVLEYSEGGLEASIESECCYRWVAGTSTSCFWWLRSGSTNTEHSKGKSRGLCANSWELQFLFLEPNASDPLNKEAAEDLRSNREGFKRNVRTSMSGGAVKHENYERVIGVGK